VLVGLVVVVVRRMIMCLTMLMRMKIKRDLLVQGNEHGSKAKALARLVVVMAV
jgi:hypothetical protein